MSFDDDDYALMKRMREHVERISDQLDGYIFDPTVADGDEVDIEPAGIAEIIGAGFYNVVKAIDRLTTAIEKLQGPQAPKEANNGDA